MLFSVVVPVKNAMKELPDCILSVLRQSCRDFELVLVCTESKDDSFDCCRRFANIDDRIKIVLPGKVSPFTAKKIGIDEAQGEYVTVFDADGWAKEDFFYSIKSVLKTGADLALFSKNLSGKSGVGLPEDVENKEDYREHLLRPALDPAYVGCFVKKSVAKRALEYYQGDVLSDEDDLLFTAYFAFASTIERCPSIYRYGKKEYFPTPYGKERISSEEALFQRLNLLAIDADCPFLLPRIVLHAYQVTEDVLKGVADKKDKEEFFDAFTRVVNSSYYYAFKEMDVETWSKKDKRFFTWLTKGRKRIAYFFLSRKPEKNKKKGK